jgi:O-methyltransferase involved in polyketide biosynthesis
MTEHPQHSAISFTAKLVALARTESDIPFARDVARFIDAKDVLPELAAVPAKDGSQIVPLMAPMIEARYKSIAQALRRSGIDQVIEFASGMSLRGLALTLERPNLTYIETDLPELTEEKENIVDSLVISTGLTCPPGHRIMSANILHWNDIEQVLTHLDSTKQVAVVHEGLFMYLTMNEKEVAAQHIRKILSLFGGVWLTPDLTTMNEKSWYRQDKRDFTRLMHAIEQRTGRSFAALSFATDEDVASFLGRMGLTYEVHPQVDGTYELSSLPETQEFHADWDQMIPNLKLWEMQLKKG